MGFSYALNSTEPCTQILETFTCILVHGRCVVFTFMYNYFIYLFDVYGLAPPRGMKTIIDGDWVG